MVKDSKRFADSGGWGYGAFEYEAGPMRVTRAANWLGEKKMPSLDAARVGECNS